MKTKYEKPIIEIEETYPESVLAESNRGVYSDFGNIEYGGVDENGSITPGVHEDNMFDFNWD